MRIDKYLKVTRLIKRRTIAKEVLEDEVIFINDKTAKPASNVKIGDVIELHLGRRKVIVEVLQVENSATQDKTKELYKILSDEIVRDT